MDHNSSRQRNQNVRNKGDNNKNVYTLQRSNQSVAWTPKKAGENAVERSERGHVLRVPPRTEGTEQPREAEEVRDG